MGVHIYCCSRNKKINDLIGGESIILNDKIQNISNIQLNNIITNNTGTITISKMNSLRNKKELYVNSKYKQSNRQNQNNEYNSRKQKILSQYNKKCTFDPRILLKPIHAKPILKNVETLYVPAINYRISHIIDINSVIEQNKDEFLEKVNKDNDLNEKNNNKNNDENNNKNSNNKIIENRRKSLISIMNLENVNEIRIKEKEDNNNLNIIQNKEEFNNNDINNNNSENNNSENNNNLQENEINNLEKKDEMILNPVIKGNANEEDEEEEDENEENNNTNKLNEPVEILYYSELKTTNLIPRPKINTLPIEVIHEPFTKKQIKILKKIMIQEELIINEMDENTIEQIIDSVEYIKVKKGINLFTRDDKMENIYYMLDKGKVEYNIDKDKYQLPRHCGIGTNALFSNSLNSCYLKCIEKSYLYKLSIEKYKIIVRHFFEEQHQLKVKFLSHNFFFNGLKLSILDKIVDCMIKIKYDNKFVLVEQDEINKNIYIIKEGHITCSLNNDKIKQLKTDEMFGEIGIYNSAVSLYEYTAEPNTTILTISFNDLFKCIGPDAPKIIMQRIFEKAVKGNEYLSKYFTAGDNLNKIFNLSKIKYYFNDIVCENKEKKIFIPVSGSAFKIIPMDYSNQHISEELVNQQIKNLYLDNYESLYSSKLDNNLYMKKKLINKKYILEKGKLNIDLITTNGNSKYYILGDECLVIEINWIDIEKNIVIPNEETQLSLIQRINLIKSIQFFKTLSPLQIFQLSNYVHLHQYKLGQIILENGPNSDKLYLIKTGSVQIKIGDVFVQTLQQGMTFGDFTTFKKITKKANYIASSQKVECYYIEKENYEDINIKDILNPLKKYLKKDKKDKNNIITLEKLYYIKELGSGSYGKVYLVHDEKQFYAMKIANIQKMNEMKELAKIYINEKNIMFSIKHPFIISIITTFKTKDFLFFLLEYIDGISLHNYIINPKRTLRNLNEAKFFLGEMSLVLHYLQKQKIIHRDLKPDNIMIDNNGYLKVIDFGVAIDITGKDYACSSIGTFHYMAPEVIRGNNYNNAVDYWSVGIIAYELFYGRLPFGNGENNPLNIFREILKKKLYLPSENEIGFNEVVKDLLEKNPKKRLNNFSQWKNYKLFNGFDFDGLLGLKMKGFFMVNKSLNNEDLKNKDISFIEYMKNKDESDITQKNKENELLEDF